MNAVGVCGLQLYRFGEVGRRKHSACHDAQLCAFHLSLCQQQTMSSVQAISLVFFTDTWRPDSFYERIASNRKQGLHTLCLLDIKVKEPSLESLARGKPVYEPARCRPCAVHHF